MVLWYPLALLIVNWDVYRFPVAFRLIRPKSHPAYQPENALLREMVGRFVPPHRWVVEGTLAWLNQNRRLSKYYEELPSTSETLVYVAMTRLMLKRLAAWYFSNKL